MTSQRTAIVLGGSGSVGAALLRELFRSDAFRTVISVSRRSLSEAVAAAHETGHTLIEALVPDMTPQSLFAATLGAARECEGELTGFSVLGVGAGTAKLTIDQHRAVDVALNDAFARALRESGKVRHLALMTAVGADPAASDTGSGAAGMARYNRVKGEAEAAVRAGGPPIVSVFRPAMILGSQHTPRLMATVLPWLSWLTPAIYKSISAEQIARAMVASAVHQPAASAVYHYPEMILFHRSMRWNS